MTFGIEVLDRAGQGSVNVAARSSPGPTVVIESEKVVKGPSAEMDFTITGTANGPGAGKNLSWSFGLASVGSVGNCDAGIWTVGGNTTTGTASGAMASGASLSVQLHIASTEAAGERVDCRLGMTFTDSEGSSFERTYIVNRHVSGVTFTE